MLLFISFTSSIFHYLFYSSAVPVSFRWDEAIMYIVPIYRGRKLLLKYERVISTLL